MSVSVLKKLLHLEKTHFLGYYNPVVVPVLDVLTYGLTGNT